MTPKKSDVVWPAGSAAAAMKRQTARAGKKPGTSTPNVTHGMELTQDWTPQELRVHPRTLAFEMGTDAEIPPRAGGPGIKIELAQWSQKSPNCLHVSVSLAPHFEEPSENSTGGPYSIDISAPMDVDAVELLATALLRAVDEASLAGLIPPRPLNVPRE